MLCAQKIKHLEMVQNIITRMNTNSFQIKGWCITVISALMGFYANNGNFKFIIAGFFSVILFWLLDAFYLQQERKFRELYNDVLPDESTIPLFAMPINNYTDCRCCIWSTIFSKTIGWLYGVIVVLLIIVGFILKYKDCIIVMC